jgi:DNA-binding transcriptional LysR family regulator
VLTREGEQLAAYGREIAERGAAVLAEIRGERAGGPVVLAAGQGALFYLLGPAIARFPKQRWPLRLIAATGPEAIEAVSSARAHLGVIAAAEPPRELAATRLREVRQHVIVPAAHRLAGKRRIDPRELANEPLIVAPAGSPHRAMVVQTLRAAGAELAVAVEVTGWELMLHLAKTGIGLAIVNDFCPPPRGCAAVPLAGAPPIAYFAVARPGALSAGAQRLRELVIGSAG